MNIARIGILLVLVFMVSFQSNVFSQEKREKLSVIDIDLSIYPEKVKFGDIVFLRINHKNNTNEYVKIEAAYSKTSGRLNGVRYHVAVSDGNNKLWERKVILPHRTDGWGSGNLTIKPNGNFEIYDAILMPPSNQNDEQYLSSTVGKNITTDNLLKHPFVKKIINSPDKSCFFHVYCGTGTNSAESKICVTMRKDAEMNLLLKFFNRQLKNSYKNIPIEVRSSNKSIGNEIVDKGLSVALSGITANGMEYLSKEMESGTLKDWIVLNKNVPVDGQDICLDHLVKSYKTPDAHFWLWLQKLPEIQRNYFAITVLNTYCSRIISKIPYAFETDFETGKLDKYRNEYKKNKMQYDKILNDWLPLLSQSEGEISIIKKQINQVRPK
jgi:hypothetical protein